MKTRTSSISCILFVTLLLLPLSCSKKKETTLERVKREGIVRIGIANDIPYAYVDSNGRVTGEAPEIARRILANMGIQQIEGVYTEFGSLIDSLNAGRFDIIAAGMFITPDRCQTIAFSEPTYGVGQAFLVKIGNPKNLHSYEDLLNNSESILAVMAGAVEGDYARAVGVPEFQLSIVPDPPTGLIAVKTGKADALALTSIAISRLVATDEEQEVEMAQPFSDPIINGKTIHGYGAFGFRKEDTDFLEAFNTHLKVFIGGDEHIELVRPFGFTELPGDVTAETLCREYGTQ